MKRLAVLALCIAGMLLASCSGLLDAFSGPSGTIDVVSSTPAQGAKISNNQQLAVVVKYSSSVTNAGQYLLKTDVLGSDGSGTFSFKDQVLAAHAGTVTLYGTFNTVFNPPSPYKLSFRLAFQTTDSLLGSPTYGQTIWKQDATKDIDGYYMK